MRNPKTDKDGTDVTVFGKYYDPLSIIKKCHGSCVDDEMPQVASDHIEVGKG